MNERETARRSQRQAAEVKAEASVQQSPASEADSTKAKEHPQEESRGAPIFKREVLQQGAVRPATDAGNAERLVDLFSDNIRYCPNLGWFIWDRQRWKRDEARLILQLAKQAARRIQTEAEEQSSDKTSDYLTGHADRSESLHSLKAMVALAETEPGIPVSAEDFDSGKMLLNAQNGTIDLRTGELRPHRREDLNTSIAPVDYDSEASAPRWEAFLARIFAGNHELIGFLRRAVGYSLTGETGEQCLFICHGHGANGKSVLLSILNELAGDYGQVLRSESLMVRKNRGISNDIAALRGARFVSANEINEGERLDEARVKELTGGDKVRARHLYRDEFEFKPTFKLWVAANHRPNIQGGDHAIWRRIHVIPFEVTIPEDERDPYLIDKLREELPGILAWAVRGAVKWADGGLSIPGAVREATAAYREEMDPLAEFLTACCDRASSYKARAQELYTAYELWCSANGEECITQTAFGRRLAEHGFVKKADGRGRIYVGIKLREASAGARS